MFMTCSLGLFLSLAEDKIGRSLNEFAASKSESIFVIDHLVTSFAEFQRPKFREFFQEQSGGNSTNTPKLVKKSKQVLLA